MVTKRINQIEPWIDKDDENEIIKVVRSGWITEASKTKEFESLLAKFTGSSYCSVVCNGTVSLFTGLYALGIGRGDEVIVPAMTMVATPNAVVLARAKPVLADIDKKNLCIDPDDVEKKITKKTKAIIPVPFNGRSPDMDRLDALAKKYNLFILEDAAQALGCFYKNKHLGTFGDIGSFSFSTPKVITTGQGGALVTNNKILYEKMIRIKDFGRIDRNSQDHDVIGFNFKFTDMQAALGISQMKKLQWRLKRKKEIYTLYKKNLDGIKQITFIKTDLTQTSPWFIDVIVPDPKALKNYLNQHNIGTREFYPTINTTKPYLSEEKYTNSLWASEHGLWLPSSSFLSDNDIIYICEVISGYFKNNK